MIFLCPVFLSTLHFSINSVSALVNNAMKGKQLLTTLNLNFVTSFIILNFTPRESLLVCVQKVIEVTFPMR